MLMDVLDRREDVLACVTFPGTTWITPDGRKWAPQDVLIGWQPRLSDRWGCSMLAHWIRSKQVSVSHVDLPQPLAVHRLSDPAWRAVAAMGFGSDESDLEPDAWLGRADLALYFEEPKLVSTLVEFGTCSPGKFVLNIGSCWVCDWMIVPYGCPYGFEFHVNAGRPLLRVSDKLLDGIDADSNRPL